jgi:hypothetical protein
MSLLDKLKTTLNHLEESTNHFEQIKNHFTEEYQSLKNLEPNTSLVSSLPINWTTHLTSDYR